MFQIKLPPNNGGSVVLDALTASDKPTLNTIAANNAIILFDLVAFIFLLSTETSGYAGGGILRKKALASSIERSELLMKYQSK